jgi:hypothetical protein
MAMARQPMGVIPPPAGWWRGIVVLWMILDRPATVPAILVTRPVRKESTMKLKFLGTTSNDGECPTLYETDDGRIVVQGDRLTDPEALACLRDVKSSETFVVIPRELLTRFAPRD